MQQIPLSLRTRAPDSRMISLVSRSLVIYAVSPTAEDPLPDVYIPQGETLLIKLRICDFAVEGSPIKSTLISDL